MSAQPTGVWLQDGSLIYRLQQTNFGLSNCDEIDAKQVGGSRATASRTARAAELIKLIEAEHSNELGELIGCFDAALSEGLEEALAETTDLRLKDLVERRLMYGYHNAVIGRSGSEKGGARCLRCTS